MAETIQERINTYLQDTIAAERNFEDALSSFGKSGQQPEVQRLLSSFSAKAKTQHQRLTALLEKRGGSPSSAKTALAEMLAFSPLSAQIGQGTAEKNTQHLMVTFAAAAAEKAMYESLAAAGAQAGDADVESLARTLQHETKAQYEQLTSRLHALGGSTSAFKSILAHIFNVAPKIAQAGHDPFERLTQNLMMAYAVENAEVAMYEALAEACRTAGDTETERLALSIQQQEKATAEKVWAQLGRTAQMSVRAVSRSASAR
jgi:ferritin-like metal-binding protein YciE